MIIEYWYGTTTEAGASFSERLTHISALTEIAPASANSPRLRRSGVTQPNGDSSAPSAKVPMNCVDAKVYGRNFAAGYPETEKLSEVLLELNETSLSQLRRDHETGHLEHKIANASK
jgi:hypothetical protein